MKLKAEERAFRKILEEIDSIRVNLFFLLYFEDSFILSIDDRVIIRNWDDILCLRSKWKYKLL